MTRATTAQQTAAGIVAALPGMKEDELTRLGPCAICGQPMLAGGDITFYAVTIRRAGFEPKALIRHFGLGTQIGPLAAVMGGDEDLAKVIAGPESVAVHERCADIGHLLRLFPDDEPTT